jgi:hypothetical protein
MPLSTFDCGPRLAGRGTWFSELLIRSLLGRNGDEDGMTHRTVVTVLFSIYLLFLCSKKVPHPASPQST